ncbi:hypothetical protein J8I29_13185 [Labrys sp. LIt4]|uniref:hypothetical protein n=1 Tax=Labrys sp. LIt4 TaxID=2821355 RepID=UPI001ADECB9F|nr:hypothetical protein [Labrys sp. LIt4]MBP0580271.1 hypothetical protein [Labrys sp. LIt4]
MRSLVPPVAAMTLDRHDRSPTPAQGSIVERASWLRYGVCAEPLRNEHMLNCYEPFLVVAFPGGKDCADLVARARRSGVRIVETDTP